MANMDNAGVYKLTDDMAIVQTVDFFTPVVDDPFSFGQIAVVNALSDIYTMGAKPLTAMNIVCFPAETMDISVLQAVLQGGARISQQLLRVDDAGYRQSVFQLRIVYAVPAEQNNVCLDHLAGAALQNGLQDGDIHRFGGEADDVHCR